MSFLFKKMTVDVSKKSLIDSIKVREDLSLISSLQDILYDFNISSKAYQLSFKDIKLSYLPVISIVKQEQETSFAVIYEISEKYVKFYTSTNGEISMLIEDFNEIFTGFTLIPLIDKFSGDSNYKENIKNDRIRISLIRCLLVLIFLGVLLILYAFYCYSFFIFNLLITLFILKLIGIIFVLKIIKIELNKEDVFIQKLCKKNNCNKVINSIIAKKISWISLGDLGMMYFASTLTLIIISVFLFSTIGIIHVLFMLNLAIIPFTFVSVIYQKVKFKALCPFCLSVIVVLWLELIGYITFLDIIDLSLKLHLIIFVIFVHIFILMIWLNFKQILAQSEVSISYKQIVYYVKSDVLLFNAIISLSNKEPVLIMKHEFDLGNPDSSHKIILILKRDCFECKQLIRQVVKFTSSYPNLLHITLRFWCDESNSVENIYIEKLYTLLLGKNNCKKDLISLLADNEGEVDPDDLFNNRVDHNYEASRILISQNKWINSIEVRHTPLIIYNNVKLPKWYLFNDVINVINRIKNEKKEFV